MKPANRREFLRDGAALAAAGCVGATGCVPVGNSSLPDLVWGRRGISEGRFLKPRAITIDDRDQLYIVDTTGRIQVFDVEGNLLRWWSTPLTKNGRPTGMAVRPPFKAASKTTAKTTAKTPANTTAKTPANTTAAITTASKNLPATGPSRKGTDSLEDSPRLLVADTHYYRMLSYSLAGELQPLEQIGGTAGHQPGEFAFVTDAVCDHEGCFYIGEYNASDRIQKFDPDGNFLTQWGGNGHGPGKFVRPQSLVVRDHVLWVADSCNHRIQRFDIREETPQLIDIWGGPGTEKGQFYYPYDLAIAGDGTVLVIEYKNNRIQRFDAEGKWIASWGAPGFDPGLLNQPWGLVIDSKDRVHVLDSNNHRVQRIELPS